MMTEKTEQKAKSNLHCAFLCWKENPSFLCTAFFYDEMTFVCYLAKNLLRYPSVHGKLYRTWSSMEENATALTSYSRAYHSTYPWFAIDLLAPHEIMQVTLLAALKNPNSLTKPDDIEVRIGNEEPFDALSNAITNLLF